MGDEGELVPEGSGNVGLATGRGDRSGPDSLGISASRERRLVRDGATHPQRPHGKNGGHGRGLRKRRRGLLFDDFQFRERTEFFLHPGRLRFSRVTQPRIFEVL